MTKLLSADRPSRCVPEFIRGIEMRRLRRGEVRDAIPAPVPSSEDPMKAPIVPTLALLAVGVYIPVRTLHPSHSEPHAGPPVPIRERAVDGRMEFAMDWSKLEGFAAPNGERVDWRAKVTEQSEQHVFSFCVRYETPDGRAWDEEAGKPAALVYDGRQVVLPRRRWQFHNAGVVWTVVDCEGSIDDLNSLAEASGVQFRFAGQTCDLGGRGTVGLRELMRRFKAKQAGRSSHVAESGSADSTVSRREPSR